MNEELLMNARKLKYQNQSANKEEVVPVSFLNEKYHFENDGGGLLSYGVSGELQMDENTYVSAIFLPTNAPLFLVTSQSTMEENAELQPDEMLEMYASVSSAKDSAYRDAMIYLDAKTDETMAEAMLEADDTANFGERFGNQRHDDKRIVYAEKAENDIYYQVLRVEDSYTFSTSRKSVYLKMALEDEYSDLYGSKFEPESIQYGSDISKFSEEDQNILLTLKDRLNERMRGYAMQIDTRDALDKYRCNEVISLIVDVRHGEKGDLHIAEMKIRREDDSNLYIMIFDADNGQTIWCTGRESVYSYIHGTSNAKPGDALIESTTNWGESKESWYSDFYAKLEEISKTTFRSGKTSYVWNQGDEDPYQILSLEK